MQSPELTLCGQDVNLLLGQVDSVDKVDYKSLAPDVYDLLAARLSVCFSFPVHSENAWHACTVYMHKGEHQNICANTSLAKRLP